MVIKVPKSAVDTGYILNEDGSYSIWDIEKWKKDHPGMQLVDSFTHKLWQARQLAKCKADIYKIEKSAVRSEHVKDRLAESVCDSADNLLKSIDEYLKNRMSLIDKHLDSIKNSGEYLDW